MSKNLNKKEIDKFSRQIILKNIGPLGQKKILDSKVLIIGMGGLGCPAADFLTRSGIGKLGIVDHDTVSLSNIHRQSLYDEKDLNHSKVIIAKKKLNRINPKTKINLYNFKMDRVKFEKIIKNYDFIIDGTDNFESKFLIISIKLSCSFSKRIPVILLSIISILLGILFAITTQPAPIASRMVLEFPS